MKNKEWKKLKVDSIVKVTWDDAWYRYSLSELNSPLVTHTLGWITYIDKEGIKVCGEKSDSGYRHEYYVPRKMVTKVRVMK